MIEKVGVGIITCNRPDMLKVCYNSIPKNKVDELIIINDGSPLEEIYDCKTINHLTNVGVGGSKNEALKYLIDKKCEHIFIIEDDMELLREDIFDKYINTSKETGIQHLMFGYHGPANKNNISKGSPAPRLILEYSEDTKLALNRHCVGAFCYYTRGSLVQTGLIDEKYKNAFDHVSHSYKLALNGLSTPYWWWSDVWKSTDYIREQKCSEESSSIKTPEQHDKWVSNIQQSMQLFKEQFGVLPFGPEGVKDTPEEEVVKFIKQKYGSTKS
jgi:glycosyltransferase involved in cell wall biosynthesis